MSNDDKQQKKENKWKFLSDNEMRIIFNNENSKNYCVGGYVDLISNMVVLLRGNCSYIYVPISIFTPCGNGITPDFNDFEIIDHGQTLRFGKYEASFDFVLSEFDPLLKARRQQQKKTIKEHL